MIVSHPANCSCVCHSDPGNKRLEMVTLNQDDSVRRRCFSRAGLIGFVDPSGYRCRDCGQYYGVGPGNQLRPIVADQTYGPHPDVAPSPLDPPVLLLWRVLNRLTPAFAPVWLQVKIRDGLRERDWEIVTRWTMV